MVRYNEKKTYESLSYSWLIGMLTMVRNSFTSNFVAIAVSLPIAPRSAEPSACHRLDRDLSIGSGKAFENGYSIECLINYIRNMLILIMNLVIRLIESDSRVLEQLEVWNNYSGQKMEVSLREDSHAVKHAHFAASLRRDWLSTTCMPTAHT